MYDNLQEKYVSSAFKMFKKCKALSNFGFNSIIREKYTGYRNFLEIRS